MPARKGARKRAAVTSPPAVVKNNSGRQSAHKPGNARRRANALGTAQLLNFYRKAAKKIGDIDFVAVAAAVRGRATMLLRTGGGGLQRLSSQLSLLMRMIKQRWDEKRDLPWRTVAALTVMFIYFVGPFDLIPDFIPVVGFLDDAAVLALCFKLIRHDLREYAAAEGLDLAAYGFEI